jgi:hypothetical protein
MRGADVNELDIGWRADKIPGVYGASQLWDLRRCQQSVDKLAIYSFLPLVGA